MSQLRQPLLCLATFSLLSLPQLLAQVPDAPTLLVAIDQRPALSLNGDWHILPDPYQAGLFSFHGAANPNGYFNDDHYTPTDNKLIEYDFARSPTIKVPGDWNTQREDLRLYEGGLWYERHFTLQPKGHDRSFLHIGAANYRARAYVNGQFVCEHEGGFTPFDCEITAALQSAAKQPVAKQSAAKPGENSVVLFVDNTRIADGIPTLKTDWYNYGGITRDVSVVSVPTAFIDDFDLHLDRASRTRIQGYVHVEAAPLGTPVSVSIPELGLHANAETNAQGRVAVDLPTSKLSLWSPENPKLYNVVMKAGTAQEADTLTDPIGFRTIETSGSRILLNGKPIVLHGISIHAEAPMRGGRANNDQDVTTLFGWVKELGANYVRLAHYPHDQRMTRAADKLGILVWSEVPVYWAVQFANPAVFEKSRQQLHEMIRRDRDKASVLFWSIANETPSSAARTDFLTRSAAYVRTYDPTRLITAALLVHGGTGADTHTKYIDDPLGKALDVIGFNEYIGWYEMTPEDADATTWKLAYDKPHLVSEFGGGAKAGLHGAATQRWTEEYQASLFRHQIGMLDKIPQLRGATPWILMDFRSPVRLLPGIQDGFNRKGLISDQGQKKAAFFVLQNAYKTNTLAHAE